MLRGQRRRMIGPMTTSNEPVEAFQIPIEAAEFYEAAFVPAFFAQWAPVLCDAAGIASGQAVLDVACGSGIVARTAAEIVAPGGSVTGLDLNEAMLTVARRVRPGLDWRQGDAAALPFPDRSFDAVLCQMALMFLPDRAKAVREMRRVATIGGTVAIAVPGALERQAAFAPFVDKAAELAGVEAYSLLNSYFACGSLEDLAGLVEGCGLRVATRRSHLGTYRAPSVDAFVTTEVESTPLVERMSPEVYGRIREEAHVVLAPFTAADGSVSAPFEANIVVGRR